MVESRCGILCSACSYSCAGCMNIEKPFWGESCSIKACCEGAGLSHCGQCKKFPCPMLHDFAYDPQQGDGGRRILHCRQWKEEETGGPVKEKPGC